MAPSLAPAWSAVWLHHVSIGVVVVSVLAALLRVALLDSGDPFHCNALLHQGQWLDSFTNWQPDGCMLYKYKPKDSEQCLSGKRVVFVGDSVTRQLFFSLAHVMDSTLSTSPTSQEKHSDHHLTTSGSTSLQFYWDPFLNSTRTKQILDGGNTGETPPALLVFGSGLWFLRHAESGGISAWEGTIEKLLDQITLSMPGLADDVVVLPVQEPVTDKLSEERAAVLHPADIDAMNSDLIHRLQSNPGVGSNNPYAASQQPIPVSIPTIFNKMLDPSQTEDGLHFSESVVSSQAQILLNLRCNEVLPKKFPMDKTCCRRYPYPGLLQSLVLLLAVMWGPAAKLLRPRYGEKSWFSHIFPSKEYEDPAAMFGLAIGLAYVADRTGLWFKEQKQFDTITFASVSVLAVILGLATVQRGSKDLGFLNRQQTDEWKGWMQIAILIYHYLGASKISSIYAPIRVMVASYLFMTGYGHTTYYLKKANFSLLRIAQVLVRLNMLTIVLAYTMDSDYLFYYFAPLVSFWYLILYATLAIRSDLNERTPILLLKIFASAALVTIFFSMPTLLEKLFNFLEIFFHIHWSAREWAFRVKLDLWIVYFGMLVAVAYLKIRELRIMDKPNWIWVQRSAFAFSGFALIWYLSFEISQKDKFAYNAKHPYIAIIPVMAFVILRNATPVLRSASSQLFAFIGTCSLETFIMQYHFWLAGDTKGILLVIPGTKWRSLNVVVTSIMFIWLSHKLASATGELTNMVCGAKKAELPTVAPTNIQALDPTSSAAAESIPLVSNGDETPKEEANGEFSSKEVGVERGDSAHLVWMRSMVPSAFTLPVRLGGILVVLWIVNLAW